MLGLLTSSLKVIWFIKFFSRMCDSLRKSCSRKERVHSGKHWSEKESPFLRYHKWRQTYFHRKSKECCVYFNSVLRSRALGLQKVWGADHQRKVGWLQLAHGSAAWSGRGLARYTGTLHDELCYDYLGNMTK